MRNVNDSTKQAVVLLLLIRCWLLLPFWDSVIVLCFVVRYFVSILALQSSRWGRDSWLLCFVCALFVFLVSCDCCVALSHDTTGLSAVLNFGISWSYSLTVFVYHYFNQWVKGLTSWLSFAMSNCDVVTFPLVLGQVWCLIISIPDLCPLSYFHDKFKTRSEVQYTILKPSWFSCSIS